MLNWKQYKLSELAEVQLSNVDKKTNADEKTVSLCNYTDVYNNAFINKKNSQSFMVATCNENEFKKFLLKEGQVAITKDSETTDDIGVPTYIANDFQDVVLGYHLSLITPNKNKLDGKFLYYWLNTKQAKYYFTHNSGGSGQRCSLSLDVIKSTPIFIPSIEKQKSIGNILFNIDSKIEINNRINAELEAMAKTIYDYWFVQFDFPHPFKKIVTDKNGRRTELVEVKPYKSSGGKMVYNKDLKREIPHGWEVKRLSEFINIFDSKRIPLSNQERQKRTGKIPYYGATSVMGYIDDFIFDDDYILLAEDGSVMDDNGMPIVQFIWGKTWVNNHAHVIQAKEKKYNEFLFQLLKRIPVVLIKTGSIQMKINQENLLKHSVLVPCENLILEYSQKSDTIRKCLINNIEQNQQLTELRDWLLPMLMNGQVTVKDAEEIINKNTTTPKAAEPKTSYGGK